MWRSWWKRKHRSLDCWACIRDVRWIDGACSKALRCRTRSRFTRGRMSECRARAESWNRWWRIRCGTRSLTTSGWMSVACGQRSEGGVEPGGGLLRIYAEVVEIGHRVGYGAKTYLA